MCIDKQTDFMVEKNTNFDQNKTDIKNCQQTKTARNSVTLTQTNTNARLCLHHGLSL